MVTVFGVSCSLHLHDEVDHRLCETRLVNKKKETFRTFVFARTNQKKEKKRKMSLGEEKIVEYEFGTYQGQFDDATQRRHGTGVMRWKSGNAYEGGWINGAPHGTGKKTYANGDVYLGLWVDGKRHGDGRYHFSAGHEYRGAYANDECSGWGTLMLANGAGLYAGEWAHGRKHGKGMEHGRNPNVRYEGEFEKGQRHGRGVMTVRGGNQSDAAAAAAAAADDDDGDLEYHNQSETSAAPPPPPSKTTTQWFETLWLEGTQVGGPRIEEDVRQQRSTSSASGPIADAASLEALRKAGVSTEAVQALGAFSNGVERSFGALGSGVAGMENQISGLCSALDSMLGAMDAEEEEGEDDEEEEGFADMEYPLPGQRK